jgi:hypothetical protein
MNKFKIMAGARTMHTKRLRRRYGTRRSRLSAGHRVFVHPKHKGVFKVGSTQFDPVAQPATLAGSTPHFHVYYANVLGPAGQSIAQSALKNCERDYKTLSGYFGLQQELQFNIIIAPLSKHMDGTGGAYHHSCLATDLYCDVQLTPTIDPDVTNALVIAEEVEVFEAVQAKGWQCGGSNGEGLSRVLASALYPGVLEKLGYASAADWLNSRRPNFVGRTLPTDRSGLGNGCAVLFLNYLHVQLGLGWDKICQAAAPRLAGTYKALTGKKAPFAEFAALLEKKFPSGQHTDLATDNPFPINEAPAAAGETKSGGTKPSPRSKSK